MTRKSILVSIALCLFALVHLLHAQQTGLPTKRTKSISGTIVKIDEKQNKVSLKTESKEGSKTEEFDIMSGNVAVFIDGAPKSLGDIQDGVEATLTVVESGNYVTEFQIGKRLPWWAVIGSLALAIMISFAVGNYITKSMRMADYGWKVGLVASSLLCGLIIIWAGWPPKYGVDLRGGVTLIYEIEEPEGRSADGAQSERPSAQALATLLAERVDPSGTREISIRPFGPDRIEIIVPDVGPAEVENIKRRLTQAGYLQFRIVANQHKHQALIDRAKSQKGETRIVDAQGKEIGRWVDVGKEKDELARSAYPDFKAGVTNETIRDKKTKEWINIPFEDVHRRSRNEDPVYGKRKVNFAEYLAKDYIREDGSQGGIRDIEVLMWTNDGINLEGSHLSSVRSSFDQYAKPSINFNPTTRGAILCGALTGGNLPEGNFSNRLGIVLDNQLISAPTIQGTITSRGEITGSFTQDEVNELVNILRAGKLPAALKKQPLSEDRVDSHLGVEMRERGKFAIGTSLLLVIAFVIFYYRLSGLVAAFALAMNVILVVAIVILLKQPFSLTGLAGLVLTFGMSVDANVLIFERLREELERGSTLRMAIRNGFDRATTTIVDSNLTTLITAVVLYVIGTEQIRGFAVSLILGILLSMYTAIFCARVFFDIAERQKWISSLSMMRWMTNSHFDFMGKQAICIFCSVGLIIVGLVAVAYRGKGIYAIDLSGGYSVRMVLKERTELSAIQAQLAKSLDGMRYQGSRVTYTVSPMPDNSPAQQGGMYLAYKVDLSIPAPAATSKAGDVERDAKSFNYQSQFAKLDRDSDQTLTVTEFDGLEKSDLTTLIRISPLATKQGADAAALFTYLDNNGDAKLSRLEFVWLEPVEIIKEVFRTNDGSLLAMNSLEFAPIELVQADTTAPQNDTAPKVNGPDDAAPKTDDAKTSETKTDGVKTDDGATKTEPSVPDDSATKKPADSETGSAKKDPTGDGKKDETKPAEPKPDESKTEENKGGAQIDRPSDELLALNDGIPVLLAQAESTDPAKSSETKSPETKADGADTKKSDTEKAETKKIEEPATTTGDATNKDGAAKQPEPEDKTTADQPAATTTEPDAATTKTNDIEKGDQDSEVIQRPFFKSKLTFGQAIETAALSERIVRTAESAGIGYVTESDVQLSGVGDTEEGVRGFTEWELTIRAKQEDAQLILEQFKTEHNQEPYFRGESEVGSSIASSTQVRALGAILASLIGVVAYIWVRFQRVVFGLAAVVALIHDVLFVLGAIAISLWLPTVFGLEEFKISLPVVAAILTIIGYSLNDTIVVFDRIREVRGKSPDLTSDMINRSICATLSRTILTGLTTMIVVIILYGWGGDEIHGFAFTMFVGCVVGTYSSIFIASPILLWLIGSNKASSKNTL